jgi:hypothetical protein
MVMTRIGKQERIDEITERLRQAMSRASKANGQALEAARDAGAAISDAKALLQGAAFRTWCRKVGIARSWAYKLMQLASQWSDVPAARAWSAKRCEEPVLGVESMLKVLARWRASERAEDDVAEGDQQQAARPRRNRHRARDDEKKKLRVAAMRITLLEEMIQKLGAVPPARSDIEATVIAEALRESGEPEKDGNEEADAGPKRVVDETPAGEPVPKSRVQRRKGGRPTAPRPLHHPVHPAGLLLLPPPGPDGDEPQAVGAVIWRKMKTPPAEFRIRR